MQLSKYNIISKVHNSQNYFIVNSLYGQADIIDSSEHQRIINQEVLNDNTYTGKGYVVDPAKEDELYKKKYLDFIDERDTDEIQIFFAPTYACNFNCSYCYQSGYENENEKVPRSLVDAFFEYVHKNFAGRSKYVTLFGGEPLLNGNNHRAFIEYFIKQLNHYQLDLAIVTNAYHLKDYITLLATASVREIQVTLDGLEHAHDARRPLKNGKGSFTQITEGIDQALQASMPVNLRMVIDKDNINELPRFAQFAIKKGWTKSSLFKTQLGRNYELHYCQAQNNKLYSRLSMYQDIYQLIKQYPEILQFHKPAYSLSKFLFENGELPDPIFDACPGCKTEWAFDYTGKIYSCTATVGKSDEVLGTFYPEVKLNNDLIEQWQERDVLSINQCRGCNLQLACGGGCASVAKNESKQICSPDCRPVTELLELGIALYSETEE